MKGAYNRASSSKKSCSLSRQDPRCRNCPLLGECIKNKRGQRDSSGLSDRLSSGRRFRRLRRGDYSKNDYASRGQQIPYSERNRLNPDYKFSNELFSSPSYRSILLEHSLSAGFSPVFYSSYR